MQKRKLGKKLAVNKETLRRLEPGELRRAPGGADDGILSWDSDCFWGTCGKDSCVGACTLNCSWFCGDDGAAPVDGIAGK